MSELAYETIPYWQQVDGNDEPYPRVEPQQVLASDLTLIGDAALRSALEEKLAGTTDNFASVVVAKASGELSHVYHVPRSPLAAPCANSET